jgi:hypothetical protein
MPNEELKNTFGAKFVSLDFNPAENQSVTEIKTAAAIFANVVKELQDKAESGAAKRRYAKALTEIEDASMWAVKAVFSKDV